MGGRYLVSGVQIGLLKTLRTKERLDLIDEIIDKQFIGESTGDLEDDATYLYNGGFFHAHVHDGKDDYTEDFKEQ